MDDYIEKIKSFKMMIFKIIAYFVITNFAIGSILYIFHIGAQKEGLFNEISEKAHTIGSSIELLIERAIFVGIPFLDIKGLQEYLDKKLTATEELQYIFATDLNGNVVAQTTKAPNSLRGTLIQYALTTDVLKDEMAPFKVFSYVNIPIPIIVESQNNKHYGYLHLGVSIKAVNDKISNIFFDIAIILFVSLVIGFEFIRFTFVNYISTPLNDFLSGISRVARGDLSMIFSIRSKIGIYHYLEKLNQLSIYYSSRILKIISEFNKISKSNYLYEMIKDNIVELKENVFLPADNKPGVAPLTPTLENLRLVVFLSLICEGIVLTIAPGYTGQFYTDNFFISKQLFSSLPVLIFSITSFLSLPFGLILSTKYGFRKTFQVGFWIYATGFFIVCVAGDYILPFFICRVFNGIGFGILYISFQNYVGIYSAPEKRVKNYAIYLVAQGAAFLTGMPVGGLLVDNIGYFSTFLLCAVLTFLALLYSWRYIIDYQGFENTKVENPVVTPLKITKIPGLSRIILCLAFPARFIYTSLLAVLDPLYLSQLGNSMSIVGRVLMIYGIIQFCISPYSSKLMSYIKRPIISCIACNCLIAFSLLIQYSLESTAGVIIGITLYSVGAVLQVSSMMAVLENYVAERNDLNYQLTFSIYFTYERIAMLCAPLLSAIFLSLLGYKLTFLIFFAMVLIPNIIFMFIENGKKNIFAKKGEAA